MPTEDIITSPILLQAITEDNPRGTRVDEFGETVDFYRLRYVYYNNPTSDTWVLSVTQGSNSWNYTIPPGAVGTYNVPVGRRIDWHSYTIGVSRQ